MKLAVLLISLLLAPAFAIAQPATGKRMVTVSLHAETASVYPGQTFWAAIEQKISPGWHTYWINPGDAGEPMTLDWALPAGFTTGEIEWPLPQIMPVAALMNYGYKDNALFLVKMKAPDTLPAGDLKFTVNARWLVCEEVCIPEQASAEMTLPRAPDKSSAFPSAKGAAIAEAAAKLPVASPWPASFKLNDTSLRLVMKDAAADLGGKPAARLFPIGWGQIDNAAAQTVSVEGKDLLIDVKRGDLKGQTLQSLKGLVVIGGDSGPDRKGYWIDATASSDTLAPVVSPTSVDVSPGGGPGQVEASVLGLITAMGFAFLGGLILNLMPCVLPVLSLKALSLAQQSESDRRRHGIAYFLGVMASFAVFAGVIAGLRAGGGMIGWGFQFQSPAFVLGLAVLFFVLGLSLSGVFSIGLGVTGVGDGLTRSGGPQGAFFTGVLATIAATPCTAPFMGAALGYALAQPAAQMTAVLLALGVGFALPMVLLSVSPALGRCLPRPGAWMETLKQVMAFPLFATAAWLVWVLSVQLGSDGVLAAAVVLTGAAFAAWLVGQAQQSGASWSRAGAFATGLLVLTAGALMLPAPQTSPQQVAVSNSGGLQAEPFSRARIAELRAEGRPVFVNFTAAWCITCKANERFALSGNGVAQAFAASRVAYLKADWTTYSAEITAELQSFGRSGVPLYVLYPAGSTGEPQILPQILTEGTVIASIDRLPTAQAKGELRNVN